MRFFLFILLFSQGFNLLFAGNAWFPVYSAPDTAIEKGENGFVKNILHRADKQRHEIHIEVKQPSELKYLQEIYVYLDNDTNGKYEKCLSWNLQTNAGWLFHLNEKDDWKNWEKNSGLGFILKDFLELSFEEKAFKGADIQPVFMVQISLKFNNKKEYYSLCGFLAETDNSLNTGVDGNVNIQEKDPLVFSRKNKNSPNYINPEKLAFIRQGNFLVAALKTNYAPARKIQSLDIRFFDKSDKAYRYYINMNFLTGAYLIHDPVKNQWTQFYLPFKSAAGLEWLLPVNYFDKIEDKDIYITYTVSDNGTYYNRLFFQSAKNAGKFYTSAGDFTPAEMVYYNQEFTIRKKALDFERVFLKEEAGWVYLLIKNNAAEYNDLNEISVYTDSNTNGLPDKAYRLLLNEDYFVINHLDDSWNWDKYEEVYYHRFTIDNYIAVMFKNNYRSITGGDYKIQLHYNREKDNYFQIRKSSRKITGKNLDGKLDDWKEDELKTFKTVSAFNRDKGDYPARGYMAFNRDYAVLGAASLKRDYTNLTNFRIFFDTDFEGNWNYAIDFSVWNCEGHLYALDNVNNWAGNSGHDIMTGLTINEGIEAFFPLKELPFNPAKAYIAFSFVYTAEGKTVYYDLYGKTFNEPFPVVFDGKNRGEWGAADILANDRILDNIKEGDINIRNVYYKKSGSSFLFAMDFAANLNAAAKRVLVNIDTDGDAKINRHISIDLLGGYCFGYKPENTNDYSQYTLLTGAVCTLEKDFLEMALPASYFSASGSNTIPEITFGVEYEKQGSLEYDYILTGIIPENRKKDFDRLKNLKPTVITDNGNYAGRIDVVILPDGYRDNEKEKFITTARQTVKAFLENKTFSLFKEDFNFYYLFVPSADSGAYDVVKGGKIPDTVYKAGIWENPLYTTKGRLEVLHSLHNVPDYDVIWLISNNDGSGAGTGSPVMGLGGLAIWGSAGIQTAIHETGHALFALADEYENENLAKLTLQPVKENYINMRNVTVLDEIDFSTEESFKKSLKWGWVYDFPDLKNIAGVYEGAHYMPFDRYRAEKTCVMRNGEPGGGSRFCVVCLDTIAGKMAEITGKSYNRNEFFANPLVFTAYDKTRMQYKGETRKLDILLATGSTESANDPEKSIDSDFYTYWESANPAAILYDLKKNRQIGALFLALFQDEKNSYAYTYQIFISSDNINYTRVYSADNWKPVDTEGTFIDVNQFGRYIKIVCLESKPYNRFYLRDFILFSNDIENSGLLGYKELKAKIF